MNKFNNCFYKLGFAFLIAASSQGYAEEFDVLSYVPSTVSDHVVYYCADFTSDDEQAMNSMAKEISSELEKIQKQIEEEGRSLESAKASGLVNEDAEKELQNNAFVLMSIRKDLSAIISRVYEAKAEINRRALSVIVNKAIEAGKLPKNIIVQKESSIMIAGSEINSLTKALMEFSKKEDEAFKKATSPQQKAKAVKAAFIDKANMSKMKADELRTYIIEDVISSRIRVFLRESGKAE